MRTPLVAPSARTVIGPLLRSPARPLIGLAMALAGAGVLVGTPATPGRIALAAPRPKAPAKPLSKTAEQKEAERHFQSGVALFKEAKYAEALAEFERANEISPQPLVLYNIAGCHRELSHYSEAVAYYGRFLTEGKGKVKPARLTQAQAELDGILARIARVTVSVTPALHDITLIVDGTPLDKAEMPLILPPGEHRVVVRAAGRQDSERSVRVASGDEIAVDLELAEVPPPAATPAPIASTSVEHEAPVAIAAPIHHRFALGAGVGANLVRFGDGGVSTVGLAVALGSRFEVGLAGVFTAYAAIPSVRVRLAGDAVSLHAIGAVPVTFKNQMTEGFAAVAGGLGLRLRPAGSNLALRLEAFVSIAFNGHGTTYPSFLGGELWF